MSQDLAGLAWVRYDDTLHRQAAITGKCRWPQVSSSLYSICIPVEYKRQARVSCATHLIKDCTLMADTDPELQSKIKAMVVTHHRNEGKVPTVSLQVAVHGMQTIIYLTTADIVVCMCSGCGEPHHKSNI